MNSQKDYDLLLQKYNILASRCSHSEELLAQKEKQWEKKEADMIRTDKKTRELCEKILAKDKREMVLGTDYTWSKLSTEDLVDKSKKCFAEYNLKRTKLLNDIMKLAEDRRFQIESLMDQINQMVVGQQMSSVDLQEIVENATAAKTEQIAKEKAPNKIKEAVKSGNVQLVIEEDSDCEAIEVNGEMKQIKELMNANEQARITAHSIPISDSQKKKSQMESAREDAVMSHMVDLNEYEERISDIMWAVICVIGSYGIAKYSEIEAQVQADYEEIAQSKSKVRLGTQTLYKMGVITQEVLKLPLTPKVFVHKLSDIGQRLYKKKTGKNHVISEIDKIIKEHDNLEHGFGIMDVACVLKESGNFSEVHSYNRSQAIPLPNGESYIPDIICIGRHREYIEYERGNHTQSDFNKKCNKMAQVTRYLNFVAPNKEILSKKIIPQINAWIAARDVKSLRNIKIRATTPLALKESENEDNLNWLVIYDLRKGPDPVKTIE